MDRLRAAANGPTRGRLAPQIRCAYRARPCRHGLRGHRPRRRRARVSSYSGRGRQLRTRRGGGGPRGRARPGPRHLSTRPRLGAACWRSSGRGIRLVQPTRSPRTPPTCPRFAERPSPRLPTAHRRKRWIGHSRLSRSIGLIRATRYWPPTSRHRPTRARSQRRWQSRRSNSSPSSWRHPSGRSSTSIRGQSWSRRPTRPKRATEPRSGAASRRSGLRGWRRLPGSQASETAPWRTQARSAARASCCWSLLGAS